MHVCKCVSVQHFSLQWNKSVIQKCVHDEILRNVTKICNEMSLKCYKNVRQTIKKKILEVKECSNHIFLEILTIFCSHQNRTNKNQIYVSTKIQVQKYV